jgi:hypothetical protein
LGVFSEKVGSNELSVAHPMTHQAGWFLDSAPSPTPVLPTGDQHAVADLAELLEHDRQLLPRLGRLGEAPADTCGPTERRGAPTAVEGARLLG